MGRTITHICLLMLGVWSCAAPASAELIQHTYTGELDLIIGSPPAPWEGVGEGSPFIVRYVFDSETPDQQSAPSYGRYDLISAEIVIDDVLVSVGGQSYLTVDLTEQNLVVALPQLPFEGSAVIDMYAVPGEIASDALPIEINVNDYYPFARRFRFGWIGGEAGGTVDAITSTVIPTPAITPLMMIGVFLARRRPRCA